MSKQNENENKANMLDLSKLSAADLMALASKKQEEEREAAFVDIDNALQHIPSASRNTKILLAGMLNKSATVEDIGKHFALYNKSGEVDSNNIAYCLKALRDLQSAGFEITIKAPEKKEEAPEA